MSGATWFFRDWLLQLLRGQSRLWKKQSAFLGPFQERGAFDNAKNHKRQLRKRQSVTAKREKSQTPKFV